MRTLICMTRSLRRSVEIASGTRVKPKLKERITRPEADVEPCTRGSVPPKSSELSLPLPR